MNIFGGDSTIDLLRTTLGRASRRAEILASNLANVDTPDYRAVDVRFDELIAGSALPGPERTHPNHLSPSTDEQIRGRLFESPVTRMRNDGNTVDVDREMTLLASTAGRFRTATEMVRKRFALLIYAGTDGRSR
jgi:flagellar basal-body rod protein FlgB